MTVADALSERLWDNGPLLSGEPDAAGIVRPATERSLLDFLPGHG